MNVRSSCASLLAILLVESVMTNAFVGRFRRQDDDATAAPSDKVMKCIKCKNYEDCGAETNTEMECSKEKMEEVLGADESPEKALWTQLAAKHAVLAEPAADAKCFTIQWEKSELRGCWPKMVEEKAMCEIVKDFNVTFCQDCDAMETPCNNDTSLKSKSTEDTVSASLQISLDPTLCFWLISAILLKLML
jgi:hypothetical protein